LKAQADPGRAPVRSMTGYAQVRRQTSAGELTCSLRTVNHRGLDLHFYSNGEMAPFESAMRALIKQHVGRGHVEIRATVVRSSGSTGVAYDAQALRRYMTAFQQASHDFGLAGKPDLNVLFTFPGVLTDAQRPEPLDSRFEPELLDVLAACIGELNASRGREGAALIRELTALLDEVERAARKLIAIRQQVLPHFQARLRERLAELLSGSGVPEARIIEEAAVLADKSDIQEELTRLTVHVRELRRIFEDGGEIGKRIDFVLQEMNRETNTTLAKSAGAGEPGLEITNIALGVKANIERMREQSLNLE